MSGEYLTMGRLVIISQQCLKGDWHTVPKGGLAHLMGGLGATAPSRSLLPH